MNAAQYAAITTAVQDIIARHSENDTDRAAGLVARAALLAMRDRRDASAKAYALADELATEGVENERRDRTRSARR